MQNSRPIQIKDSEKPKLILKTGNITKISTIPNQQKQLLHSTSTKKVLPVANNKNLEPIKPNKLVETKSNKLESFEVSKNVFELTTNSKPTKWIYTNLNDPNTKPAHLIIPNPEISFTFH